MLTHFNLLNKIYIYIYIINRNFSNRSDVVNIEIVCGAEKLNENNQFFQIKSPSRRLEIVQFCNFFFEML